MCCDVNSCKEALLSKFTEKWKSDIKRKPKLRTYCLLKENFTTEKYVLLNLTCSHVVMV